MCRLILEEMKSAELVVRELLGLHGTSQFGD